MKGFGKQYKSKKNADKKTKFSKEQLINEAFKLHSQGKISEAAKFYQFFISQGFYDHKVFSNYGTILQNLGKREKAEKLYRKAIEIKPDFANAHLNLGVILKDIGKLKEAELSIRKAVEIKPDFTNAHLNLGIILKDIGKLKEAEISYRKAIEINPDYANAHLNLGNILKDIGKLKEAVLSMRKAIEINPDCGEAYYNLGNILNDIHDLREAEISYRKAIEINPDFANAHLNLGVILKDIGKLKEAELSFRKAIEINPDFTKAHLNLGIILNDIGKLKEAELSFRKAIEINPDYAEAYKSISTLKFSDKNISWRNQLFSKNILKNKSKKDQVHFYFARANVLHKEKKYEKSSTNLLLANNLKLDLYPSNADTLINKSNTLLVESKQKKINQKEQKFSPESIFIVGMPRSGSTLLESILSMNNYVYDLGEINILEESFLEYKKRRKDVNLAEIYKKKIKNKTHFKITTNKWLYNYQYAGVIARYISNAKIIHCYRNPLDNILSIYRADFGKGNDYSSSLVDCTRVYLDQENTMTEYKNIFRSKIYDLNYDLLVTNPKKEIESLISWLDWEMDDLYLSPHLNPRSVSTASNVQVRYPINSESIGGWKNYANLLKPSIEILTRHNKYLDLIS